MADKLPDVYYGPVSGPHVPRVIPEDNIPDDDVELETTLADVISMLGFDPKEED